MSAVSAQRARSVVSLPDGDDLPRDVVLNGLLDGRQVTLVWSERTHELYVVPRGGDSRDVIEVFGVVDTYEAAVALVEGAGFGVPAAGPEKRLEMVREAARLR